MTSILSILALLLSMLCIIVSLWSYNICKQLGKIADAIKEQTERMLSQEEVK